MSVDDFTLFGWLNHRDLVETVVVEGLVWYDIEPSRPLAPLIADAYLSVVCDHLTQLNIPPDLSRWDAARCRLEQLAELGVDARRLIGLWWPGRFTALEAVTLAIEALIRFKATADTRDTIGMAVVQLTRDRHRAAANLRAAADRIEAA